MQALHSITSAEVFLNTALHCVLILAFCVVILRLLKSRSAPLRSGICLVTLVGVLLLPVLSFTLSQWGYSPFLTSLPLGLGTGDALPLTYSTEMGGQFLDPDVSPAQQNRGLSFVFGSGPRIITLINLFGTIWILGAACSLIRVQIGAASVFELKKNIRPVREPRINLILDKAAKTFAKPIRTRVYETADVDGPMVVGFFRPIILLPPQLLEQLSEIEVCSILLHELAHIHHRDQITGFVQRIVTALNWWNPMTYSLSSTLSRAREEVSDNYVLLQNDSTTYAECLVNLAERVSVKRNLPVVIAMASPHIPLKDRVFTILSKERKMETRLNKPAVLVLVMAAFVLLGGVAGYRLTFAADAEEAGPPAAFLPGLTNSPSQKTPPKLIKKVDPVYPKQARDSEIQGTVVLEMSMDTSGRVYQVEVLRGEQDILIQAAKKAAEQWIYEPMTIDGKPQPFQVSITCSFWFRENKPGVTIMDGVGEGPQSKAPVRAVGDVKPPKMLKRVDPIYPDEAKKDGIQGVVILEATADIYGRVKNVKILRSIPELNAAAKEAVQQWVYEPTIINNEPREIIFTVTCRFELKDTKEEGIVGGVVSGGMEKGVTEGTDEKEPIRATGEVKPPQLIKRVDPIYPDEAKKDEIEGVVILELETDIYGRVKRAKILRSIPALDQAALNAVNQWVYEPLVVEGESRSVIFTVTCRFKLK